MIFAVLANVGATRGRGGWRTEPATRNQASIASDKSLPPLCGKARMGGDARKRGLFAGTRYRCLCLNRGAISAIRATAKINPSIQPWIV